MSPKIAWCETCTARREVLDAFEHSEFEHQGEVPYWITLLSCGHNIEAPVGAARPYSWVDSAPRTPPARTMPYDLEGFEQ